MLVSVCAHLGGCVWKPEVDIESLLFTLLGALRQGLLVNSTHWPGWLLLLASLLSYSPSDCWN